MSTPSDFVCPLLQAESEASSLYNSEMGIPSPLLQRKHRMGENDGLFGPW